MSVPSIPFLDLVAPHLALEEEMVEVFRRVLATAGFIGGPMVEEFEREFAAFCDVDHAIAVSSGTDALRFALMASGVKPGDVVVTVPHTFIATTEAITQSGALPEFVDIDERTYTLSVERLEEYLSVQCTTGLDGSLRSRRSGRPVTAIVPVHLYGQMADMDPILEVAERYNLLVIEDACQAHGAEYYSRRGGRWRRAGSMGHAAAFSFYPGKNLGACGEAGAATTNQGAVASRMRVLRDHGQSRKYYHEIEGYNGRLDALQAGLLQIKLRHLEGWNEQRRERAASYRCLLASNTLLTLPYEPSWSRAVYHLYVVRAPERDRVIEYLKEAGIGTGIHYPVPLHMQRAYATHGYATEDFPVSAAVAAEIVSLPMFPQLTRNQQERVAGELLAFAAASSPKQVDSAAGELLIAEQMA
jgi:dTDP-4-amino-4,6-dideoxygalactose transaminase